MPRHWDCRWHKVVACTLGVRTAASAGRGADDTGAEEDPRRDPRGRPCRRIVGRLRLANRPLVAGRTQRVGGAAIARRAAFSPLPSAGDA